MIHYSCDRCRRTIDPEIEVRYAIRIEIQASVDSPNADVDDDGDHLLELQEILERLEDSQCVDISDDIYQRRKYDLCPSCYREYIKNPLAMEPSIQKVGFSDN